MGLLSYSLPWVAEAAGVRFDHHHDPEADARAAASVLIAIAQHHGTASFKEIAKSTRPTRVDERRHLERVSSDVIGDARCSPWSEPNASPDHPFYGREVVFTGTLSSMTRAMAWERVAEVGGQPAPGVTKQTNVVVVGYQDARKLRPGEGLSAKARKARDLRDHGQEVELMPEVDFIQLLAL